jgi:hypothetical protein
VLRWRKDSQLLDAAGNRRLTWKLKEEKQAFPASAARAWLLTDASERRTAAFLHENGSPPFN